MEVEGLEGQWVTQSGNQIFLLSSRGTTVESRTLDTLCRAVDIGL